MNETTILLSPAPNAKPEFLATVEPLVSTAANTDLPFDLILDSYTRDKWASSASSSGGESEWKGIYLKSIDGRRKLPGFLKYLKERQKASFGRFDANPTGSEGQKAVKGIFVVPFTQPPPPQVLLDRAEVFEDEVVYVRYIMDETKVKGLQKPGSASSSSAAVAPQQQRQKAPTAKRPPQQQKQPAPQKSSSGGRKGGMGGMLGNLLGATQRTNAHLAVVPSNKKKEGGAADPTPAAEAASAIGGGGGGDDAGGGGPTTFGEVIMKFRSDTEQKLLDFESSSENVIKISISLAALTKTLPPDQKARVTMDVMKFVVYEQAEEIGEDAWVAAKEPSEFMDEAVVAVYKEGHAPAEVLEELNKGDLPDEVRGQERAMREERVKQVARKEQKQDALRFQQTVGGGAGMDFSTLNTNKRDRRTIEEIQRDLNQGDAKRPRT